MNTDPISDMLTRIRNASIATKNTAILPYSKIKEETVKIFKNYKYIQDFNIDKKNNKKFINIVMGENTNINFVRVSKPGHRIYVKSGNIPIIMHGKGIVIISTSKGLMTGQQARRNKIGGELICKVW